jgi:hypothetical protein
MKEYEKQLEAHIEVLHLQKSRVEHELEKVSQECRDTIKREQENTIAFIRFAMAVAQIVDTENIVRQRGSVYIMLKGKNLTLPEEIYDTIFKPPV